MVKDGKLNKRQVSWNISTADEKRDENIKRSTTVPGFQKIIQNRKPVKVRKII